MVTTSIVSCGLLLLYVGTIEWSLWRVARNTSLKKLEALQELHISHFSFLNVFDILSHLRKLGKLCMYNIEKFGDLEGLHTLDLKSSLVYNCQVK